jgi:hypothetical protein
MSFLARRLAFELSAMSSRSGTRLGHNHAAGTSIFFSHLLRLHIFPPIQERSLKRHMSLFSIPSNEEVERYDHHLEVSLFPRIVPARPFARLALVPLSNAP